jgi:uncharacterized protein YukE
MALLPQPSSDTVAAQINPASQPADAPPALDVEAAINAQEASLAEYLNQPVRDILARLGLPPNPGDSSQPDTPVADPPAGQANPFDPSQLIQPVTDALGTLGSGQFGDVDPTQVFGGISKTLDSAGQSVQQALAALDGGWAGDAATAAGDKTSAALADGAEVASQANGLAESLSTVAANVKQAEARLIEIITEFWAKIAAIGPNIIFPWGIAAAIAAANEAITMATEVISELQSSLGAEAGNVAAVGAPVAVTSAPTLGTQAIGPMLQMATGLVSPVMQAVSAATSAAQSEATNTPDKAQDSEGNREQSIPGDTAPHNAAFGGGVGAAGGIPGGTPASRLATPPITAPATSAATHGNTVSATPVRTGGSPMMGGAPLGHGARPGADSGHTAASFLHTSDQGDEIVGDLGNVAPPVLGEMETNDRSDIELRI